MKFWLSFSFRKIHNLKVSWWEGLLKKVQFFLFFELFLKVILFPFIWVLYRLHQCRDSQLFLTSFHQNDSLILSIVRWYQSKQLLSWQFYQYLLLVRCLLLCIWLLLSIVMLFIYLEDVEVISSKHHMFVYIVNEWERWLKTSQYFSEFKYSRRDIFLRVGLKMIMFSQNLFVLPQQDHNFSKGEGWQLLEPARNKKNYLNTKMR